MNALNELLAKVQARIAAYQAVDLPEHPLDFTSDDNAEAAFSQGAIEALQYVLKIAADQPGAKPLLPTVLVHIDQSGLVKVASEIQLNLHIRDEQACMDDQGDEAVADMFENFWWDTFTEHHTASTLPDLSEVISTHHQKQS